MSRIHSLNDETFDYFLEAATLPVVVDFWAPWCGPCRAFLPILEEVATETEGRALVAKVNVDEAPKVAASFGIRTIPSLLYFRDTELVHQSRGVIPKTEILEHLA